jgi:hypothetical protein
MMQDLELGIRSQQTELDFPQADDVRINDIGPVMRGGDNGIEPARMTFSFPPGREGGAPCLPPPHEPSSEYEKLECPFAI